MLMHLIHNSANNQFSSVQSLSCVRLFATLWMPDLLSITNSWSLLKLMPIESGIQPSHPAISSSVIPFSSCPQFLPASGSFHMSQLFAWGGQSTGVSASALVLPMNTQDFRMDWLDLLTVQATLNSLLQITVQKHQFFDAQLSSQSNSHIHTWTLEKPLPWPDGPLLANLMSLLLNMISRLVITFLPRSKRLLISWLQSPPAVMLEPLQKIKVRHCFHCFPIYFPWSDGTRCHDLSFLNAEL